MINKEKFYNEEDYPSAGTKRLIWKNVKKSIKISRSRVFDFRRMPGFYFGFASAVVLFFFIYGVYSLGKTIIYDNKPEEIKLNSAYQSAIKEFESVMPSVISGITPKSNNRDLIIVKMEQLYSINLAISKLNGENINHDLSPLKQLSLRNLYILKLRILQEILQQGEINL